MITNRVLASSTQKRLYTISNMDAHNTSYNVPMFNELKKELSLDKFNAAINKIIRRYDILRTNFRIIDGELYQIINEFSEYNVEVEKIDEKEIESKCKEFIKPFDLDNDRLVRVKILIISQVQYIICIDIHHTLVDARSIEILKSELISLYRGEKLNDIKFQYKDFSCIEPSIRTTGKRKLFWATYLKNYKIKSALFTNNSTRNNHTVPNNIYYTLNDDMIKKVEYVSKNIGISISSFLMANFFLLLHKLYCYDDIVIGNVTNGLTDYRFQNIVGMFANTIPIRSNIEQEIGYSEYHLNFYKKLIAAYKHQDYKYENIVNDFFETESKNNKVRTQELFDVLYISTMTNENNSTTENIRALEIAANKQKYDLVCSMNKTSNSIGFGMEYNANKIDLCTVKLLFDTLMVIINYGYDNPDSTLDELKLLSQNDIKQLNEFNQTSKTYPNEKPIHEIFEEQVSKTPNNVALVFSDKSLTYKELDTKANQLSNYLVNQGLKKGDIVGIMMDRSLEMLVSIYGVMKTGCAYLPLDSNHPKERTNCIIKESGLYFILTERENDNVFDNTKKIEICTDDTSVFSGDDNRVPIFITPNDSLYIMYTSGSTGKPKGVVVEHSSVSNLLYTLQDKYPINEKGSYLLKTAYTFDVSISELFGWFLGGGKLVILNQGAEKDPQIIADEICVHSITHINFTPSMYKVFINSLSNEAVEMVNRLEYILLCGEVLENNVIRMSNERGITSLLENIYGPTEATVFATSFTCNNHDVNTPVPIGKPLSNVKIYIMNKYNQLQPVGIPGELCLSGKGLARGYFNSEALAERKFIDNPFEENEKVYRTGDLARWLPDGNLEFLGRMDNQVKIRGFRIELGEIESKLLEHNDLTEAVALVVQREDGDKYICAYIVSDKELSELLLSEFLQASLPDYMIPTQYMKLEQLPMTSNGKLDRKALPQPNFKENQSRYEAPRNDIEKKLVDIWYDVLHADQIGINDNFFELGGHSLKAMLLTSRINKELNMELSLSDIFMHLTIKGLSQKIEKSESVLYAPIEIIEEKAYYKASSAQKRMFLLHQLNQAGMHYNMANFRVIEGCLDIEKLNKAFETLINRHDILRTTFEIMDEEVIQRVHKDMAFEIFYDEMSEESAQLYADNFVQPFDLSIAPLIRVALICLSEEKYLLLFDMHHIISDGVSIGIFWDELFRLYKGEELPELLIQYKDFAAWQNDQFQKDMIKNQEAYWLEVFKDEIPLLNMPTDYTRPLVQSFEGDYVNFKIEKKTYSKLKSLLSETNTTLYMALLASFNILLSKYSGQEDIVVGSAIAGRRHADLREMLGMFINTLAMRNFPCSDMTFREFLEEVKKHALKAYENQDYQFEELVERLNVRRDMSRHTLFDVMFVLQNMEGRKSDLGELSFNSYDKASMISKFDMTLHATEGETEVYLGIEYATKLYKQETIERMVGHFLKIVDEVVQNIDVKLSDIELITSDERNQILFDFNDTKSEYPSDKTIHELFEAQVDKTPDRVAVVFEDKYLTYRELNEKSNQLAHVLRTKGVKADTIVGLMVERSIEMIIGIMGILKSGGAYLPIDPEYPKSRIEYMLEDSGTRLLLTQSFLSVDVACIDEYLYIDKTELQSGLKDNLVKVSTARDLAYVIYTSGTTGNPKGIMVEHVQVHNFMMGIVKKVELGRYNNILCTTTMNFDIFALETLVPLTKGLQIIITNNMEQNDPYKLSQIIVNTNVEVVQITPSRLKFYLENHSFKESMKSLKLLLVGGEEVTESLATRLQSEFNINIFNVYGPTETTIWSTVKPLIRNEKISIGKPIQNTQTYIIGENNCLMPIGVLGELCISGDCLSRGYLNKPELTKEKFVENPFVQGELMYKTGDIARWLPDGNLEFFGRMDNQVKIRGFRIELGEIENKLLEHNDLKEAVALVVQREDGDKYICAYIVSDRELSELLLGEFLQSSLPDYMIPTQYMKLEQLPMTSNGKLDRKALPQPSFKESQSRYEAPRTDIEKKLVDIWCDVLHADQIGINDNFFELGGHSLLVIRMARRVFEQFDVEIPLNIFFNILTIKEMSKYITNKSEYLSLINIIGNQHLSLMKYGKGKKIFLFPPRFGYGMVYSDLSKSIDNQTVFSFDFIEGKNRIDEYIKLILMNCAQYEIVLVGYSSGGNLAFEVAKELENRGYILDDIIMLDTYLRCSTLKLGRRDYVFFENAKENLLSKIDRGYLFNQLERCLNKKIESFIPYWNDLIHSGKINSRIHIIKAEDEYSDTSPYESNLLNWKDYTNGVVKIYKGYGNHSQMLDREFAELNAQIVNNILNS